ncbi:MAG: hypothetical protein ACETV1_01620, partial [Candidatus Bathyarchaeia archaeon]
MNARDRIPPNQKVTSELPVLHVGSVPRLSPENWDFVVEGLVENPVRLTYKDYRSIEVRNGSESSDSLPSRNRDT